MGNAAGSTGISQADIKMLMENTPFTEKEVVQLLQRYSTYDNSEKGSTGMSLADCLSLSEFSGDKCIAGIVEAHLNEKTHCIHPKSFLNVCSLLSSKTSTKAKKDYLFQMLDVYNRGILTHNEIFRLYKLLFYGAITDDHILDLTFQALRHPDLNQPGEITKNEFFKMIPDNEIISRMNADFNFIKV